MNREKRLLLLFVLISFLLTSFIKNTSTDLLIGQTQNPILFIHGRGGDTTNWKDMIKRFTDDGWPNSTLFAYNFENSIYCTEQQNFDNANQIKQWVNDILATTGAKKIDLVAHSMGGISSRYYIKFLADHNSIDDYVTLGSPHHGSPTQNCVYSYDTPTTFMISLNEGDETPGGILDDTIGERNDMFLGVTYNGTHIPGNISYISIYSSDDKIVTPYKTSYLEGAQNILMQGLNHTELVTTQSGYEQVKEAVEDQAPITSSSTTSQTTTTTSTTPSQTAGVTLLASCLSLIVIHSIPRKKK